MCVCVTGVCGGTQKAWDQIAWLSLSNVNSTRKTTHVCAHIQTHTGWIKRWSRGIFFKTFVCPGLLLIVRWESFSHCTPTQAVSQKSREARHKGLNWAWTCHFYVLDRCKTCQIMQKRKKKDRKERYCIFSLGHWSSAKPNLSKTMPPNRLSFLMCFGRFEI